MILFAPAGRACEAFDDDLDELEEELEEEDSSAGNNSNAN